MTTAHHRHSLNCSCKAGAYSQSLEELDFSRSIFQACVDGDFTRVRKFIEKNPETVKVCDGSGYTALHYAVKTGNIDICRFLIEHDADINAQTPELKSTPLHRSITSSHNELAMYLLENKRCDIKLLDADNESILHKAAKTRNFSLLNNIVSGVKRKLNSSDFNILVNVTDRHGKKWWENWEGEEGIDGLKGS
ncbi:ankyrin repeat-containing domain protein [Paraphysoderma sedebokerense]|nr:ankyrin repeat-containing domain protein [Paraphysoderma sedebokerense]KAI9142619.1 ankyrin repeat-containing domain protein [Paraphysoderma sedebokerense]